VITITASLISLGKHCGMWPRQFLRKHLADCNLIQTFCLRCDKLVAVSRLERILTLVENLHVKSGCGQKFGETRKLPEK
jgi:hypothetical protein